MSFYTNMLLILQLEWSCTPYAVPDGTCFMKMCIWYPHSFCKWETGFYVLYRPLRIHTVLWQIWAAQFYLAAKLTIPCCFIPAICWPKYVYRALFFIFPTKGWFNVDKNQTAPWPRTQNVVRWWCCFWETSSGFAKRCWKISFFSAWSSRAWALSPGCFNIPDSPLSQRIIPEFPRKIENSGFKGKSAGATVAASSPLI